MPRIIWFALGAVAGMVYASRLIEQEKLDVPEGMIGTSTTNDLQAQHGPGGKEKLALMIEERTAQIGEMIQARGREIAGKLRSQEDTGVQVQPHLQPTTSPFGEPSLLNPQEAAALGVRYQPEMGLESSR